MGHAQVEDQQVDTVPARGLERGGAVGDGLDLVALELEGAGDRLPDGPVVLGQDKVLCRHGFFLSDRSETPVSR